MKYSPAFSKSLPIWEIADEVNEALARSGSVVVTAEPGAGKSTVLPLTVLSAIRDGGKVLMLEPRRVAARQIAARMAALLGESVGETVGYRVRFESRVSRATRIEVLTEGILTRMLVDDPTLEGVSAVLFDEFHERSLQSDLAFALCRSTRKILRQDLWIAVLSATLDAGPICSALKASLVVGKGKMFPVDIRYCNPEGTTAESVAHIVRKALREEQGDILAFLPGEAEIRQASALLEGNSIAEVCPLYGNLSPAEQDHALAPSREGERKVVLATPIAETSLTIEGVRVVVDSGLCRRMVFDRSCSLSHLETVRISKDMARQRTGRAGRTQSGICYRLWDKGTESRMAGMRTPEILEADLAPMYLDIAAWGEADPESLPWLTPPPTGHIAHARSLLTRLGAVDRDGRITRHGSDLQRIPCHPRIAQMLSLAPDEDSRALACDIAALLEEKDPMAGNNDADLGARISALRAGRRSRKSGEWGRIDRSAEEYRRIANVHCRADRDPAPQEIGALVAEAYPERIGKNIGGGKFALSSGSTGTLQPGDPMAMDPWIAVASMNADAMGRIFLAAPVDPEDIDTEEVECIAWDERNDRAVAELQRRAGSLVVSAKPLPHKGEVKDHIVEAICNAVAKNGIQLLDFSDPGVVNLQRRVALCSQWHPELELPDLGTDAVCSRASGWLPAFLDGATTKSDLKKIDLTKALSGLLSWEQKNALDKIVPASVEVPSGSRIRLEYRSGSDVPVLHVRLQECFGLTDTPRVDNGRRPVLMELLSPGFKPVQLTQDLRSFWSGTYFEVRKELRRRYPKHFWPDDPLEAPAVRGVKRK